MTRSLELKIPPLASGIAFTAAVLALARFVPAANVPFPGHRIFAVGALVTGAAIAAVGIVQFRRARTTIHPLRPHETTALVVSGVYRVTRNPMYLGIAVTLTGVAGWHSTLLGYALVPLFCLVMTELQIKAEERALRAAFGERFARYAAEVRRWI